VTLTAFQNWVVQTGLMVSLLIVIILLIRRPFARAFGANAAYALWSLPLIRLCLPGFSIPQQWVPKFLKQSSVEAPLIAPAEGLPNREFIQMPDAGVFTPPQPMTLESIELGAIIIAIWLTVAIVWLSYQLVQQVRFKSSLIKQSEAPSLELSSEIKLAAAAVALRASPNVRVALNEVGPLVTGVWNPLVIVPHKFAETFDSQQRHFALVHEFAHVKRRDLWVALATLVFRAINWPNPLVHYASQKLRGDQEAACDAYVVKVTGGETAHSYAETLVKAVRQDRGGTQPKGHLALSLTQAETENSKGDEK